jgi:uncharacterized membrane protein
MLITYLNNILNFKLWADTIEFVGALLIVSYLLVACLVLLRTKDITRARLVAADGAITGLSFKMAGTLLKTIQLQTWQQLLMFVVIFALRTILKRFFTWEQQHLQMLKDKPI